MELEEYFKKGKAYIWKGTFAIIKAREIVSNAFVNIIDKDEITVIIDQSDFDKQNVIDIEKDWKIVTLDIVFPMDVCGVTAKISDALAKEGISVMPIAAFSRDHFLIKEKDVEKAVIVFENLGIKIYHSDRS